ncbi:multiheme c-type cytochrome [Marinagarivorans algicola]|uniref:multiheme c-type cytochrome n=1 Tax=Marinagarivorans algicola TaxID=1513270 RepID=UPI00138EEFA4|nr:multiheme c-type cytochrome [Marinagarivorans algicola]
METPIPANTDTAFDHGSQTQCKTCHDDIYAQWETSTMKYGAVSPTFRTLEQIGNTTLGGALAKDGGRTEEGLAVNTSLFCQKCHSPIGVIKDEFKAFDANGPTPSVAGLTKGALDGVTCTVCHNTFSNDTEFTSNRFTSNKVGITQGIANAALNIDIFSDYYFVQGPGDGHTRANGFPFDPGSPNANGVSGQTNAISNSQFCGGCHDVRTNPPAPLSTAVTEDDENFLRLENLFTEWERSTYNPKTTNEAFKNDGIEGRCQDCHMSSYPYRYELLTEKWVFDPKAKPDTSGDNITHYFTGVDIALADNTLSNKIGEAAEDFAAQDIGNTFDKKGFPSSPRQRRDDLLKRAVELKADVPFLHSSKVLPLTVTLENTGTGHHVPSGFSQERQMWIEVLVVDANNKVVYHSGYTKDTTSPSDTGFGNGAIADIEYNASYIQQTSQSMNDLFNLDVRLNPSNFEVTDDSIVETADGQHLRYGKDQNLRNDHDHPANLGLVFFGNEFKRNGEEVFSPFLANEMDNSHSLPPLEPRTYDYDIPLVREQGLDPYAYPLTITTKLNFRQFPPRFLRGLIEFDAQHNNGNDQILNSGNQNSNAALKGKGLEILQRNHIIEMASQTFTVNDPNKNLGSVYKRFFSTQ